MGKFFSFIKVSLRKRTGWGIRGSGLRSSNTLPPQPTSSRLSFLWSCLTQLLLLIFLGVSLREKGC